MFENYQRVRVTALVIAFILGPLTASGNELAPAINAFESIALPAPDVRAGSLTLQLSLDDRELQLLLEPNTALLNGLTPHQRAQALSGDTRFYGGRIDGIPSSWVRLSWLNNGWVGGFFDGQALYLIDAAADVRDALPHAPSTDTVLFRASDLALPWPVDNGAVFAADELLEHLPETAQRGTLEQLPITVVTDTQYNGIHGGNTASVVMSRVNFVDGIYTSQVGVSISVVHLEQLNNNGPLTSTDAQTLLFAFQDFIRTGPGSNIPQNGVTHLFTGRNLNGTTVGIAFLGVLCSNTFGFGVDQNVASGTTSALIFAHELGHNFNAPHDGEDACVNEPFNGIMNPSINGSQQFSDCSLMQMAPEVASASCLISVDEEIFLSGFEG